MNIVEQLLQNEPLCREVRAKKKTSARLRQESGVQCADWEWRAFRSEVFRRGLGRQGVVSPKVEPAAPVKMELKEDTRPSWRELCRHADATIALRKRGSFAQDEVTWAAPEDQDEILIVPLADWHAGSKGTQHSLLEEFTDDILSIPNAHVILLGDMIQMAIKMRSVAEVNDHVLSPSQQMDFVESWLDEIGHRVICSCWDNHSVEREEKAVGFSNYARIMARRVAYHDGIGHANLKLGAQEYRLALSHKFRGRSYMNPLHSQQRYGRFEGLDREIILAGDSHVPGMAMYRDGEKLRLALNAGTMQTGSSFGKRYFSIKTKPDFPVFTISAKEHRVTPFWSLKSYLDSRG